MNGIFENELEYIDKNEWNFSNEDKEYMEFTRNDSDHGLKYVSFDNHIKSNLIDDEPIETRPFEVTFYEFIEASPQRIDIKRE